MVDYEKIDKYLKVILILVLIVLLITMRVYKLDSCDLIKEKTNGMSQAQIVNAYYGECLINYRSQMEQTFTSFNNTLTVLKP